MTQTSNKPQSIAHEKGNNDMQNETITPTTEQTQVVRRGLPYQDLRTVPLNKLLNKILAGSASSAEDNEAERRIHTFWSDLYADKRFASKKRASITLWNAGVKDINKARQQRAHFGLLNTIGESGIHEFMDHNVGRQEYLGRFSALDLVNMAIGYQDPEDRYKPWTRGLYALSERFENFGTVFAGPSDFTLCFPIDPETTYTMTGEGLYELLSQVDPTTIQPAPGTSLCVMPGWQDGIPPWDAYTMVIEAGAVINTRTQGQLMFPNAFRVTMPYEIYAWIMLVGIAVETIELQDPVAQANQRRKLQLRTDIYDKKLGGKRPQNSLEIDYAESLYRYMNQKKGEEQAIFGDGRRLKGMTVENLRSLDAFLPAWTDLQASRDEQARIRAENQAKEKAARRATAIANREARERGEQPYNDEPIVTGNSDPLEGPDLLP